jgi:hypothetical protein
MDNLDCLWQRVYVAAVREAYGSRMLLRICEALAAIEQRRLNPLDNDGEEALSDAERVLETLKAELIRRGGLKFRAPFQWSRTSKSETRRSRTSHSASSLADIPGSDTQQESMQVLLKLRSATEPLQLPD